MPLYDRGYKKLLVLRSFVLIGVIKVCEYCKNGKILTAELRHSTCELGRYISAIRGEKLISSALVQTAEIGPFAVMIETKLNYCPICGRDLRSVLNDKD